MRLIDADNLLTEIMDSDLDHLQRNDWKEVIQIVQDAPTVAQWIPCSERLPDEEGEYITTLKDYMGTFVSSHAFDGKEFGFYSHDEHDNLEWNPVTNVIAWMPLPKPWKETPHD